VGHSEVARLAKNRHAQFARHSVEDGVGEIGAVASEIPGTRLEIRYHY
jgi:hypothetical protein